MEKPLHLYYVSYIGCLVIDEPFLIYSEVRKVV